jgi:O-antigen ligase
MRAITPAVLCFSGVVAAAQLGSRPLFALALLTSLAAAGWLVRRRGYSGFELLIVAVPTYFYPPVPGKFIASVADPIMLVLVAALLLGGAARPDAARRSGIRLVIGWAFVVQLVAWASLVWPLLSLRGASLPAGAMAAVKLGLMALYVAVAFLGALQQLRRGDHRFLDVWADTAAAVALVALAGLLLFSRGIDVGLHYDLRATGTFADRRRRSALSWHLIPIAAAVLLTGSRATFLALVVAVALTSLVGGARRAGSRFRLAAVVALAGALVLLAALPRSLTGPSLARATGVLEWDNPDDNRFHLWRMAVRMWEEQPFLGVGLGLFRTASATMLATPTDFFPHSTYLGLLSEVGIVGLAVIVALPLLVVVGLVAARLAGHPFATFFLFSAVSFGVMAATLNLENFRPFWTFAGLALAMVAAPVNPADGDVRAVLVTRAPDRRIPTWT